MNDLLIKLHSYTFVGASFLLLLQAIILFVRSKNHVVRKTLALLESFWGTGYLIGLVLMNLVLPPDEYVLLREKYVILGGFYISFMVIYLMQILIPGWLNWKRFFYIESPMIAMTAIYYGVTYLLDESILSISSYAMLADSFGYFNVWFRLVFLLVEIVYIVLMLRWLHGFEQKYIQWENENYSNSDYMDITWIKLYYYIILGITIFFLAGFFIGGHICIVCHTIFVSISFSYLFYKALFYESPYPKNFYANQECESAENVDFDSYPISADEKSEEITERAFDNKIEDYKKMLKDWLDEEKPYLYKDFKLRDVSRVLPLNRSYLSRVFNEGFGKNFSEVVRSYRVEYAKELMQREDSLPLYTIAELSGFSSDSTLIRAFKQVTGTTPNVFKQQKDS